MPSPPANAANDLTAAPSTVTAASPDTPDENKTAPELAGADLQPVEGLDAEGAAPLEPLPSIVTEAGPVLRSDIAPICRPLSPLPQSSRSCTGTRCTGARRGPKGLVAAPDGRHAPHLLVPVGQRHRPLHQAQARRRDAGGARGCADPGRSRRRRPPCASPRRSRHGPLRQGDRRRGGARRSWPREVEKALAAGRQAARRSTARRSPS